MATCPKSRPQNRKRQHAEADLLQDDLPSQIRKRRAPQRQKLGSHQNLPVPPRRSARLQSKQRSISIPQSFLKRRPTAPQTSHTRLPASDPINAPVPSRAQLQGPLQTHTHQTRKRGLDRSIETSLERSSKRPRLTVKNLKKLENMGKPAGKGSTGQSQKSKSSGSQRESLDSETKSTRSKQTISTTDSGFHDIAFDNGVLNPVNSGPPANLDLWEDRLNRTRDTASPSESEYQKFAYKIRTARNEQTVLLQTSQLLKEYETTDLGYSKVYNHPFNAFPKNVGFNNGLSAAQPDMVEGLDMPEFNPFPVRQQLGGAAVLTSGSNATTLPHLAGEWKGPGKDMIKAQTQAAYDGACMVYSRNKARSFLESPDPDGHAYVSTFTTDGTTLNTFAHYSSESQGQVKYHQYPTSSSFLISSHKDFSKGRRRLRNLQDDAKENSEKLRDELNEKWSASQQHIYEEDDEDEDNDNDDGCFLPPMSQGIQHKTADPKIGDDYNYDNQEDGEDESSTQLLIEYYSSFSKDEGKDSASFVQIPTPDASSSASKPRSKHKKKKRLRLW